MRSEMNVLSGAKAPSETTLNSAFADLATVETRLSDLVERLESAVNRIQGSRPSIAQSGPTAPEGDGFLSALEAITRSISGKVASLEMVANRFESI